MTCAESERRLADYLAGALSEPDARAFEAHAASCAACENRIELAAAPMRLSGEIAPPPTLRADVLRGVVLAQRQRRVTRWLVSASAVAAVLLFALVQQPRKKHASDVDNGAAILFAMDRARPEFESLDLAERELTAALVKSPQDPALTHALEDLRRQRALLQKMVREAAS